MEDDLPTTEGTCAGLQRSPAVPVGDVGCPSWSVRAPSKLGRRRCREVPCTVASGLDNENISAQPHPPKHAHSTAKVFIHERQLDLRASHPLFGLRDVVFRNRETMPSTYPWFLCSSECISSKDIRRRVRWISKARKSDASTSDEVTSVSGHCFTLEGQPVS